MNTTINMNHIKYDYFKQIILYHNVLRWSFADSGAQEKYERTSDHFMHTHIHTCMGIVSRPSRLFLLSSSSFIVHEMSTSSTTTDSRYSASIAFWPVDCDVACISSMESNAGLLRDRWEVYALDHNPTYLHSVHMCLFADPIRSVEQRNFINISGISTLCGKPGHRFVITAFFNLFGALFQYLHRKLF